MNAFEKSCVLVGYRHGLTIEELAEDLDLDENEVYEILDKEHML